MRNRSTSSHCCGFYFQITHVQEDAALCARYKKVNLLEGKQNQTSQNLSLNTVSTRTGILIAHDSQIRTIKIYENVHEYKGISNTSVNFLLGFADLPSWSNKKKTL